MGKNLKGKELGAGISQRKDGRYSARFVTYLCNKVYRSRDASEDASADPRTFKYQYYDEPVCTCNR